MKKCLILIFLSIVLIFSGCGGKKKPETVKKKFTIKKVDLLDQIIQTGEVEPIVKVDLKSEASGLIQKVYVKEGQRVSKGDKIIDIDPSRLLFKKERMDLAVKQAQIQKEIAKRNYNDANKLIETGTISRKRLTDLKSEYDLAEITWKQQLLELQDLEDQLSKTKVTSPMDGVITSLDVEVGEIAVSATSGFQSGTAIATIADISQLEVVSQIGEVDYINLKQGQKVVIRPEAIEGMHTTGTISFVALSAKKEQAEELGTFEVRIDIDSLIPSIAPGINVNVEFVILEKKNVLGVPNHFVKKTPKGQVVSLVTKNENGENKVVPTPVKTGATDYKHYEILSGLKEGDVVQFKENLGEKNGDRKKGRH